MRTSYFLLTLCTLLAAAAAHADGPAWGPSGQPEKSAYIRWGTPHGGDKADVELDTTVHVDAGGVSSVTAGPAMGLQTFEINRNIKDDYRHTTQNNFVDSNARLGLTIGANRGKDVVGGFYGSEQATGGHIFGGPMAAPAGFMGLTIRYGGQLIGGVPAPNNGMSLVFGPAGGLFHEQGNFALYLGMSALVGGRFYGDADGQGVTAGGGAGGGVVGGMFTKTDALRLQAQRMIWTDGSTPYSGSVSYERVLNPAVLEDSNYSTKGVRWSVGVEAQGSTATGQNTANAQGTGFVKATL